MRERARKADEAERNLPEADIPAEIARREDRLAAIAEARQRLEQRQREADLERGRDEDDDRRPCSKDGKPKGGRYKREFGNHPACQRPGELDRQRQPHHEAR